MDLPSKISPTIPQIRNEISPEKHVVYSKPTSSPSYVGLESFDWVLSYSDDIYKHLKRMEQKRLPVKSYPNIDIVRPVVINVMRNLQATYDLENTTLHLAVYILDIFLSRNSLDIEMKLMVITALILAAKVEDVDLRVPRFTELNRTMLNSGFTLMEYRDLEAKMLVCLDFNLTIPTIATFSDFFSRISVVLDDFCIYHKKQHFFVNNENQNEFQAYQYQKTLLVPFERYDEMLATVNQLLERLIDFSMESLSLINVTPSRKAAACIAAARRLYNIYPVWTPFLELQSSYAESDVLPFMEAIISIFDIRISNESSSDSDSLSPTDNECCIDSSSTNES